jgi:hypothetical protein
MPYDKNHTIEMCDKCNKKVGTHNLIKLPFLYLDKNDDVHHDMSQPGMEPGYRQYYTCKNCFRKEVKK